MHNFLLCHFNCKYLTYLDILFRILDPGNKKAFLFRDLGQVTLRNSFDNTAGQSSNELRVYSVKDL